MRVELLMIVILISVAECRGAKQWVAGLAVNANGREQLTEKRIIISLHYIYTACLPASLPSPRPECEQQSVLARLYLLVLKKTNTFFGVDASTTQGLESKGFLKLTIRHADSITCEQVLDGNELEMINEKSLKVYVGWSGCFFYLILEKVSGDA